MQHAVDAAIEELWRQAPSSAPADSHS
eukprot:COSAG02_NODE_56689_length_284_cov_0.832432_1_plen_26_part_10